MANQIDDLDIEKTEEAEEDEQDLVKYQISSYPSDLTLQGYKDKWDNGQLLIPEFQRKFVWDQVRASKLIESFMLGLPVPGVFLYKEQKTNKLQVIDGQQRILSAVRYFEGTFGERKFRLKNVHPSWNGKSYEDLSEPDQFQIQDSVLRATIVQQLDPADDSSVYHIFERLNTGGLNLSPMEIRKCVYSSNFFTLLEELNQIESWRSVVGQQNVNKRLRDVELVLRVLAMIDRWEVYEKPMKAFLNSFMANMNANQGPDHDGSVDRARATFHATCGLVIESLGAKPFHLRGRLNLGVMDSVMTMASFADADAASFRRRFESLTKDPDYLSSVTTNTSDTSVLRRRFGLARKYLLGPE